MASQKTLKLYVYVDGVNDVPFYGSDAGVYEEFITLNGENFITSDGFVFNVRNVNEQVEIGSFRYDAKRMGGAPTLTFTLMYPECLDAFWNDDVYALFNGERHFLKQTPTSSKNNDDERYKHEVELVAERRILENTYFYDAVVGDPQASDRPVTNSTKFFFYGNLEQFAQRMNASLQYTKLQTVNEDGTIDGYYVVIDPEISTNEKQLGFDEAVFFQALQESYNTFGIPFYFVGKEIHLGFTNNVIDEVIEYGADNALLSVTKSNANFKVVNRASGYGSTENIPYYYPNNVPKGQIEITASENNTGIASEDIEISDREVFDRSELRADEIYTYHVSSEVSHSIDAKVLSTGEVFPFNESSITLLQVSTTKSNPEKIEVEFLFNFDGHGDADIDLNWSLNIPNYYIYSQNENRDYTSNSHLALEVEGVYLSTDDVEQLELWYTKTEEKTRYLEWCQVVERSADFTREGHTLRQTGITIHTPNVVGEARVKVVSKLKTVGVFWESLVPAITTPSCDITFNAEVGTHITGGWKSSESNTTINMNDCGVRFLKNPVYGDSFSWSIIKYIKSSETLQPSIYRATEGAERFYNAINYPFTPKDGYVLQYAEYIGDDGLVHNDLYKQDNGKYLVFANPYIEGHPKEHVFSVEDIKPTIEEMTNEVLAYTEEDEEGNVTNVYQRIDMFSEFAYDENDNDETYIDDNGDVAYKHPYFFGKLRKLNFNLFECAIEDQPMTISMTSGHCGACTFEIGVSEDYPNQNPVQIDENGNLVYDDEGRVLCGLEDFQPLVQPQDEQQDTENYEVWIALKKEDSTYGILMPKAPKYEGETLIESGHRPKACTSANANDGDTFVIIGIKLPDEYIEFAERKLEKKIIQYITENNNEKFNFSVNFSRIFLEENEEILNNINENARFTLRYNGNDHLVYVSSFSYSFSEGDILPSISVELDNTLTIAQSVLQNAIDSVKSDVAKAINGIDVAAIGSRFFLRKDTDDIADGVIGFRKGVIFGNGGDVRVNSDGSAKLTIDYLEVTKKATFTSLEIQERNHVGGQILITPASMVCSNVEEYDNYYRCYMETQGEGGEEVFNTFAVDDQAICQTFNAWGSKYYWRLVVGIGDNYIDLSKVEGEYDEESDVPSVGDKIIQLGNRSNTARQAAQVLSSHGDDSPSFIMYNGINSFSLDGKEVTGILWNPETQEPQMYSYGSFFFGDRTTDDDGNLSGNFITFQQREGEENKSLTINATVNLSSDSTGLTDLSDWKALEEEVGNKANASDLENFSSQVTTNIENLQDQIDGAITSWFYSGVPTLDNAPANEWTTDEEKNNHLGDLYYNEDSGKAYRFQLNSSTNTYEWKLILDEDITEALGLAQKAQDTADDKRRVFYETPTPPYDEGDLWSQGTTGDLMICTTAKAEGGSYDSADWGKASKYTDDTKANEVDQKITDFEYLKETFGAPSADVDGVIMSKMVAVKNEDGEVEAFLNGSTFAGSTENKLILAAGIPETSEEGSTDPEERAKEAATRIYEDGTTYTNKMVLDDGCSIGDDLNITAYTDTEGVRKATIKAGIAASYDNGFTVTKYVGLNEQGIRTEGLSNRGTEEVIMMGDFCAGYAMKISVGSESAFLCNDYGKDVGLFVDVADGYNILSPSGMFAGLRPMTRIITASSSSSERRLTAFDHTIECQGSGTINLYLPTSPKVGQCYEIWKWTEPSVYIHTQDNKNITRLSVSEDTSQGITSGWYGIIKLVYGGNGWTMTLHHSE